MPAVSGEEVVTDNAGAAAAIVMATGAALVAEAASVTCTRMEP
jgi:hypothetical protein